MLRFLYFYKKYNGTKPSYEKGEKKEKVLIFKRVEISA